MPALPFIVGSEAFQIADGDRRRVHLQVDAAALALLLLRTDPPAYGRQCRCLLEDSGGFQEMSPLDVLDEVGDVDIDRAAFHAGRLRTVETAFRLLHGHLRGQTDVHLFQTGRGAVGRIKLRHLHPLYGGTLLGLKCLAQCLAPIPLRHPGKRGRVIFSSSLPGRTIGLSCLYGSSRSGFPCIYSAFHRLSVSSCLRSVPEQTFLSFRRFWSRLDLFERSHPLEHLVPIDEVAVELRSVNADKAGLAADGQPAGAAHPGTVHHDGIERNVVGNAVFLCQKRRELHHDRRSDCQYLVDVFPLYHFLDPHGDDSLLAVGSVIGHDNDLIRILLHVIHHDDKLLGPSGKDRDDLVACLLQCGEDGEDGCDADSSSGTDDRTVVLYA